MYGKPLHHHQERQQFDIVSPGVMVWGGSWGRVRGARFEEDQEGTPGREWGRTRAVLFRRSRIDAGNYSMIYMLVIMMHVIARRTI